MAGQLPGQRSGGLGGGTSSQPGAAFCALRSGRAQRTQVPRHSHHTAAQLSPAGACLPGLGFWGCRVASMCLCFSVWLHAQARGAPGPRTAAGTFWAWWAAADERKDEGKCNGHTEEGREAGRGWRKEGERENKCRIKKKKEPFLKGDKEEEVASWSTWIVQPSFPPDSFTNKNSKSSWLAQGGPQKLEHGTMISKVMRHTTSQVWVRPFYLFNKCTCYLKKKKKVKSYTTNKKAPQTHLKKPETEQCTLHTAGSQHPR